MVRRTHTSLTGDVTSQCFFLLYGNGSNGKSVMLETLLRVLGDYGMMAPNHLLTSVGRTQHPTAVADLEGKRFVAISEPSGGRLDETQAKALTGSDSITARRMNCDYYQFRPTHKFFMASNYRPRVDDVGHAMWRRIRVINFPVTILPNQQDKGLLDKLMAEAPGILNWLIRGCLQWRKDGLNEPAEVRQATMEYRDEMDQIGEFIAACCVTGPEQRATTTSLHAAYQRWCAENAVEAGDRLGMKEFAPLLEQKGYKAKKTMGAMTRFGIGLKLGEETEDVFRGPNAT